MQMKGALKVQDMARFLESTKLDFALGLKQREALLYKLKLGWSLSLSNPFLI